MNAAYLRRAGVSLVMAEDTIDTIHDLLSFVFYKKKRKRKRKRKKGKRKKDSNSVVYPVYDFRKHLLVDVAYSSSYCANLNAIVHVGI